MGREVGQTLEYLNKELVRFKEERRIFAMVSRCLCYCGIDQHICARISMDKQLSLHEAKAFQVYDACVGQAHAMALGVYGCK